MGKGNQKFREVVDDGVSLIEQTGDRPGRRIRAIGAVADSVNRNRRRYSSDVLRAAVEQAQAKLNRSLGRGDALLGEADHPEGNRPRVLSTVVKWEAIEFNETTRQVELDGRLIESSVGRDLLAQMDAGLFPGVSLRGYGASHIVEGDDGEPVEEVTVLVMTGFDLVFEQSFPEAGVTVLEHQEETENLENQGEEPEMSKNTPEQGAEQAPQAPVQQDVELARKITEQMEKAQAAESAKAEAEKALAEAQERETKLAAEKAELERVRKELEDAQRDREIAEAITEQAAGLKYGEAIKARVIESVKAAAPQTAEAVKALVEAKQAEVDAVLAEAKVRAMGVRVLGPVFEMETGQPEFAYPAVQLQEQMALRGRTSARDVMKDESRGALFARQMLEAYDKAYRTQLIQEAESLRQWQEAEATTDLNLPYSVMRTIIPEVHAELVATNVFDVATIDGSPSRLYFENYVAESGAAPTVTDEVVAASTSAWVALVNKRLRPGTVVLTNSAGDTTYVENTDYVIDYANGKLYTLPSPGAITNAQSLKIDYVYEKVRAGEGAAIQRGKGTLSYQTIDAAADRLATLVNDEAMTFARTQLGWDAVTRTIAMLTREIREYIDQGIIRLAVANAVISGNSGGSWTASGGDYDDLVEKLGVAKVAVENDFYMPQYFLMSKTNADRLSNWTGLTRDGFPDAILGAAGFANMQVKGLPVFSSVHMPDNVIVVCHPELVQHRVLASKPMHLEGPFQGYSSGSLVAAKEWYAEEYNATVSLIPNKGGFIKVA